VPLFTASSSLPGVTAIDLYCEYPAGKIDIEREQQRLREHDVLVFMFPIYWYSTPSILKEWQDLVLEYGFAYGHEATALKDKIFMCALTAGGPEESYQSQGFNHYSIRELLRPIEQTMEFCGMTCIAPYALFSSRLAVEERRIDQYINDWLSLLSALKNENFDIEKSRLLTILNRDLDSLIGDNQ